MRSGRPAARGGAKGRGGGACLLLLALLAGAVPVRAQDASVDAEDLPRATTLQRVTWTRSPGSTRIHFKAAAPVRPILRNPLGSRLVLDLTAVATGDVPDRLEVGTPEVRSLRRIPALPGVLPEGVSQRWFVDMAREGQGWTVETRDDGFELFVGDPEKTGSREVVFDEDSWYAERVQQGLIQDEQPPKASERLARSLAIQVRAEQPVRRSPSPLAPEMGYVLAGQTRLTDAASGEWLHLVGGGWIRQALPSQPQAVVGRPAPPPASRAARSPAQWTVITLGTGLTIDVREVIPGTQEDADALVGVFAEPVRLALLTIRVGGGVGLQFQLPPKKGRVQVVLRGGARVDSLDPRELPVVRPQDRATVDRAFEAPALAAGEAWHSLLVMPGDLDFLAVEEMRIDVGGQRHLLFRVPGSGDPLEGISEP